MSPHELGWLSAIELSRLIRARKVSPVEVIEAVLARVAELQPRLNAFCLVDVEGARAAAREAEIAVMKDEPIGPLQGVPVSVKDVLATRGLRTTAGSRMFAEAVPSEDAVAVARLRAAGAVIIGKTNTSELGHKAVTESPLFGITRNPWNPARTPGGSSGGAAAAVASGQGPVGLGSDGGGSVRIPAAFCGLYGIKPSWGRVPNHPETPGWEHFSHVGPITRTVRDAALVLDVIAGPDDRDLDSLPGEPDGHLAACDEEVKGLHVAWSPDLGFARVASEVVEVCAEAAGHFESLGCHVEAVNPGWRSPEEAFGTMVAAQFYAAWSDRLRDAESLMDPTLARFIRRGERVTAREYLDAARWMREFWLEVHAFLARFDLLLTPTAAVPPFPAGDPPPREIEGERVSVLGWMPFTYPFNITGQPAASVPAGFDAAGLPIGLQIVGRRRADRTVLAASAAFEAERPWAGLRPRLE